MSDIGNQDSQGHDPRKNLSDHGQFTFSPKSAQQHRLTPSWGRIIALAWLLNMFALVCTGASSQIIGRPVIWLDDQRWGVFTLTLLVIATCFPLMATALWSLFHGPHVWLVSVVPVIDLLVLAALDRHNSPGSAVVTLLLGVAGALSIVGAFAGRYRLSNASSATTASN